MVRTTRLSRRWIYDHYQKNSQQYWLVISDIMMPGMDGYQFIKRVKQIKPQVKVFFISAFQIDDIELRRELPFVKVDEFIQKPISLYYLMKTVKKHFVTQRIHKYPACEDQK
jgi:response regulator RpfG family c-di-GMP phosphodiesterase